MKITKEMVSKVIDHTYLKTAEHNHDHETQQRNVHNLILEAIQHGAFSVCVRPHMVMFARLAIDFFKVDLKITTVIGFPGGDQFTLDMKRQQIRQAELADDFDMVVSLKYLKNKGYDYFKEDIESCSYGVSKKVLKVILETTALTTEELEKASILVREAFIASKLPITGPRFFKTSTGFYANEKGEKGATLEAVDKIIRFGAGRDYGVKPSGGISDLETAIKFIELCDPPIVNGEIDPYKFRIGSSSLLLNLHEKDKKTGEY